jgi:hypothetical protein
MVRKVLKMKGQVFECVAGGKEVDTRMKVLEEKLKRMRSEVDPLKANVMATEKYLALNQPL